MRAALISLGSLSSKWTAEAMRKYFDTVDEIDVRDIEVDLGSDEPEVLYKGKPLQRYDCIYPKGSFKYVQILRALVSAMQDSTWIPFSGDAFTLGHDKLLTHLVLQQYKIPMPKTYISATPQGAKQVLETLSYPIVMKFPQGTQGKGVMFADSYSSASSMLDALSALKQPVILQEYIDTGGTDIRAIVIGEQVAVAMKRKANEGERRANIHAGGSGENIELDFRTKQIAVKTAQALGADICAVDILEGVRGPLVIEINMSPGLQGIMNATDVDVPDRIAKYLYTQAKRYADAEISVETKKIIADLETRPIAETKSVITNLNFRAGRIMLPEVITEISQFNDDHEVTISADKSSIIIKRSKPPSAVRSGKALKERK